MLTASSSVRACNKRSYDGSDKHMREFFPNKPTVQLQLSVEVTEGTESEKE